MIFKTQQRAWAAAARFEAEYGDGGYSYQVVPAIGWSNEHRGWYAEVWSARGNYLTVV